MSNPIVHYFFDEPTNTFSYVVRDPDSNACAVLDSVLDFDYASGRTDVRSAVEIAGCHPRYAPPDTAVGAGEHEGRAHAAAGG